MNEHGLDIIHYETEDNPGWYFWLAAWAGRMGPYNTREEASKALDRYIETESSPRTLQ